MVGDIASEPYHFFPRSQTELGNEVDRVGNENGEVLTHSPRAAAQLHAIPLHSGDPRAFVEGLALAVGSGGLGFGEVGLDAGEP